uniref:Apple domain-containing protein n=1 Tax=Chromera velia CCMP2878 TaxID=1169474 RepID=A0A0G4GSE8_9ALVE|eukprot:Cvel_5112.t1-p1 / transcript=Cvel_5112.t1 / gene=Cvel_5112 / organism=Chromera_velia_CCMP2878 / gene_product=hypothetical protein / transcript_product=hypothetical protein / location=Cvel_scaffold234:535-8442(-) / protein_length=1170 / sequence_SO=supercontig / SO=protein_coding / is_pseudo=false
MGARDQGHSRGRSREVGGRSQEGGPRLQSSENFVRLLNTSGTEGRYARGEVVASLRGRGEGPGLGDSRQSGRRMLDSSSSGMRGMHSSRGGGGRGREMVRSGQGSRRGPPYSGIESQGRGPSRGPRSSSSSFFSSRYYSSSRRGRGNDEERPTHSRAPGLEGESGVSEIRGEDEMRDSRQSFLTGSLRSSSRSLSRSARREGERRGSREGSEDEREFDHEGAEAEEGQQGKGEHGEEGQEPELDEWELRERKLERLRQMEAMTMKEKLMDMWILHKRGLIVCEPGSSPYCRNCAVSEWDGWTSCSSPCGEMGKKSRRRTILLQRPGSWCPPLQEFGACQGAPCARDCAWTEWGELSTCPFACSSVDSSGKELTLLSSRKAQVLPISGGSSCGAVGGPAAAVLGIPHLKQSGCEAPSPGCSSSSSSARVSSSSSSSSSSSRAGLVQVLKDGMSIKMASSETAAQYDPFELCTGTGAEAQPDTLKCDDPKRGLTIERALYGFRNPAPAGYSAANFERFLNVRLNSARVRRLHFDSKADSGGACEAACHSSERCGAYRWGHIPNGGDSVPEVLQCELLRKIEWAEDSVYAPLTFPDPDIPSDLLTDWRCILGVKQNGDSDNFVTYWGRSSPMVQQCALKDRARVEADCDGDGFTDLVCHDGVSSLGLFFSFFRSREQLPMKTSWMRSEEVPPSMCPGTLPIPNMRAYTGPTDEDGEGEGCVVHPNEEHVYRLADDTPVGAGRLMRKISNVREASECRKLCGEEEGCTHFALNGAMGVCKLKQLTEIQLQPNSDLKAASVACLNFADDKDTLISVENQSPCLAKGVDWLSGLPDTRRRRLENPELKVSTMLAGPTGSSSSGAAEGSTATHTGTQALVSAPKGNSVTHTAARDALECASHCRGLPTGCAFFVFEGNSGECRLAAEGMEPNISAGQAEAEGGEGGLASGYPFCEEACTVTSHTWGSLRQLSKEPLEAGTSPVGAAYLCAQRCKADAACTHWAAQAHGRTIGSAQMEAMGLNDGGQAEFSYEMDATTTKDLYSADGPAMACELFGGVGVQRAPHPGWTSGAMACHAHEESVSALPESQTWKKGAVTRETWRKWEWTQEKDESGLQPFALPVDRGTFENENQIAITTPEGETYVVDWIDPEDMKDEETGEYDRFKAIAAMRKATGMVF